MSTIDELIVQIDASTELLRRELARGSDAVETFSEKSSQHVLEFGGRLTTLTEVARGVREAFALLGVGFGLHAFASWIEDATKINKLTDEQAEKIGAERQALSALGDEVDNLARSFATTLAPAIERAAKFWRQFLFPTAGEKADARIEEIRKQIEELQKLSTENLPSFQTPSGGALGGLWGWITGSTNSSNPTERVQAIINKIKELTEERDKMIAVRDPQKDTTLDQYQIELASIKEVAAERKLMDQETIDDRERELQLQRELAEESKGQLEDIEVNAAKAMKSISFPDFFHDATNEAKKFAESFGHGLHNALVDFIVDGHARFSDFLKRLAAEVAVSGVFNLFAKGLSGSTSGFGQFFAAAFGGARAEGGPVMAGTPYLVGERGPELFMPRVSGSIVPNGGGGGATVVQNISVTADEPSIEARMAIATRVAASAAAQAVMNMLGPTR